MRAAAALFMSFATFCLGLLTLFLAGLALATQTLGVLIFGVMWIFLTILFLFLAIAWAIEDSRTV
jgi:hypothetical protein